MSGFEKLKLKNELLVNLESLGYSSMTPVQEKCLPLVIEGKDVLAQAKTGSGKTAAFGLGLLNQVEVKNTRPQSLILCPTRELAEQVAKEIRSLARQVSNIKVLTLTGGASEYHQERSLAHGAHFIVGTPGRVLKLIKRKVLSLKEAQRFVLDEADRMLDMGFNPDIMAIAEFLPAKRQTLLFSATFPDEIKQLGMKLQKDSIQVSIDTKHLENNISQEFILLDSHKNKAEALIKAINFYNPSRFIVFCKTKAITERVADLLHDKGVYVESLHGDLEQSDRTAIMNMFSGESLSAIVATDVAARGIDISDLELVVNFDLPRDPGNYTHRVGRTARAGKSGLAISFLVEQELNTMQEICDYQNLQAATKGIESLESKKLYERIPPMRTLYISGGKKDKLRPGDLVGALIGAAGLKAEDIGEINILNIVSYVAIKSELVDKAISGLNQGKIKNRKFKSGLA